MPPALSPVTRPVRAAGESPPAPPEARTEMYNHIEMFFFDERDIKGCCNYLDMGPYRLETCVLRLFLAVKHASFWRRIDGDGFFLSESSGFLKIH